LCNAVVLTTDTCRCHWFAWCCTGSDGIFSNSATFGDFYSMK